MKDPIILCPFCRCAGKHVRKLPGVRCDQKTCAQRGTLLATELQVQTLKLMIKTLERDAAKGSGWTNMKAWIDGLQASVCSAPKAQEVRREVPPAKSQG